MAESDVPTAYLPTIHSIDRGSAPYIETRMVIFTYRPRESTRFVALRFEHENYAVIHPYSINAKSIYVLVYEPPEGLDRLVYRVSVDGLWMHDPENPVWVKDIAGRRHSIVDLAGLVSPPISSLVNSHV